MTTRRRGRALLLAAASLLAAIAVAAAVQGSGDDRSPRAGAGPSSAAPHQPAAARSLLYLDRSTLKLVDVISKEHRVLEKFDAPDVFAAPSSSWLAYVTPVSPELHVFDPTSGDDRNLGVGLFPLFHPQQDLLAFLRPDDPTCDDEICKPDAQVVVYDIGRDAAESILPLGSWGLLGWSGDRLVVFDGQDLTLRSVDAGAAAVPLDLDPSEFWGASPDGRSMVVVSNGRSEFALLQDGRPSGRTRPIEVGEMTLAQGAWSPDSSRVAAIALERGRSSVVLFSPGAPHPRQLTGSEGASGDVIWSRDGKSLAFARVDPARRARLAAVFCSLTGRERCRRVFTWAEGVSLLRLE